MDEPQSKGFVQMAQSIIGALLVLICGWLGTSVSELSKSTTQLQTSLADKSEAVKDLQVATEKLREGINEIKTEQAKRTVLVDQIKSIQVRTNQLTSSRALLEKDFQIIRNRLNVLELKMTQIGSPTDPLMPQIRRLKERIANLERAKKTD